MSILDIFKRRKQAESSGRYRIDIKSKRTPLTEEQLDTIFSVVQECIDSDKEFSEIAFIIRMKLGILEPVYIRQTKRGIEVVIS